ncbi:uroporphyrin-III C-methyltransferase [Oceaniovalibus guishaninsula JLT2003]|uniref:Uroporphyrin-III C-methyltransferase n=1 Tax=Oceaniovalibus guishaninsula JLT2003 TaxID=1231392 RepID=K2GR68_9RHOB|nr:siroheme synthase CysG [Oceaniovalibus guishaninsula]EKE45086.1 uroporphyrin-III C-methyltransferase [Oceaniovalibus guishaninsula JLT2003]
MQHFPIYVNLAGRRVVLSGGGDAALAKLRLLLKTEARLTVFATDPAPEIRAWAAAKRLTLIDRAMAPGDAVCATLFYAADEDAAEDARTAAIARADGALVNIVDNLTDSAFITPAIVDRDPVTVAIGTEGAAPVLARAIKRDMEERLPSSLGSLAEAGKRFRDRAAALPHGRARRDFWAEWYDRAGPAAIAAAADLDKALSRLLDRHIARRGATGHVHFVGAGPGDPDLLTMKARHALDWADVVVHDRLVPAAILELARREARIVDVGKEGFGPATPQSAIDAMIVDFAAKGLQVVRLKSGDPTVFGRLDEEIEAVVAAGIDYTIVPGITAASAAVAAIGQSLTRRGRNGSVRLMTGHDTRGFADHDWAALARKDEVAAIYMGKRAARYIQGRLLMHGADPATPVTAIENASRPDARIIATTLAQMEPVLRDAALDGPALVLLGLAPRTSHETAAIPALEAAI